MGTTVDLKHYWLPYSKHALRVVNYHVGFLKSPINNVMHSLLSQNVAAAFDEASHPAIAYNRTSSTMA